jgi:hypothetical protein
LREVQKYEQLYVMLTAQYEEARIDEARDVVTVDVLDAPVPPERKAHPHRLLIILAFPPQLGPRRGVRVVPGGEAARIRVRDRSAVTADGTTADGCASPHPALARAARGRLRRSALANVVGRGASAVLWLVVTPLALSRLGPERFAVWSLFFVLGGYMASLDLGMSNGVSRYRRA